MKSPNCILCGSDLDLSTAVGENHLWVCSAGCPVFIDTGVPRAADLSIFQGAAFRGIDELDFAFFASPLASDHVAGAKVYMPFLLYHFIECRWGPCYMSLFKHVVKPYLDVAPVLEYVLRSPVVVDANGIQDSDLPAMKMYADLFKFLLRVDSAPVRNFVRRVFGHRYLPSAGTGYN